jgi:transposase
MVRLVRRGRSLRFVSRAFGVSVPTVQRWVERAKGVRLGRVDFSDQPRGPRRSGQRTTPAVEDQVLWIREDLREKSALGEYGAAAIYRQLQEQHTSPCPSIRTIGRILERRGVLDGRKRQRRKPPPKGWYLSDVASEHVELDAFDFVEGLVIQGGIPVQTLNVVSLHGGLVGSFPATVFYAKTTRYGIVRHWRECGLPAYAQFDNDTRFQGPHQHPDAIGQVIRMCLSLSVTPVFAPPRETGFQAAIEGYNGRWQSKVWHRFHHTSMASLKQRSVAYVAASRKRSAARIDTAPPRRAFPESWRFRPHRRLQGRIIYIRRSSDQADVSLLGRAFPVPDVGAHTLVRCEVDIDARCISFYSLNRRNPDLQPLVHQVPYRRLS